MKKKQFYEKPSMRVFELKQRQQLLASSSGDIPVVISPVVISPIVIHTHLGAIPYHSNPHSVEPIKMKRK